MNCLLPLFFALLCFFSCSEKNVAGGKTIETTNGLSGAAFIQVEGETRPASKVTVELIPVHQLGKPQRSYTTETDSTGAWHFDSFPSSPFNLFIIDSSQNHGHFKTHQSLLDTNLALDSLQLGPLSRISMDLSDIQLGIGDTLGALGSPFYKIITSEDLLQGILSFDHLPQGTYEQWVLAPVLGQPIPLQKEIVISAPGNLETTIAWPYKIPLQFNGSRLPNPLGVGQNFPLPFDLPRSLLTDFDSTQNFCLKNPEGSFFPAEVGFSATNYLELWTAPPRIQSGIDENWQLYYNAHHCSVQESPPFDSTWGLHLHLGEQRFKGSESLAPFLLSDSNFYPEALTLSALVKPDPSTLGGEILSLGNAVGIRLDHLDSVVNTYNYSAYAEANAWHILSSSQDTSTLKEGWLLLNLIVDPTNNRFDLYSNGLLISSDSTTDIQPIDYFTRGDTLRIGRHSAEDANHFFGLIDQIQVHKAVRSPQWIALQAQSFFDDSLIQVLEEAPEPK